MEITNDLIKELEASLDYKNIEFKGLVKALRENQEKMEYDRLKTEFFANISHEFKTPLNVMMGAMQLIEMYSLNGTIQDPDKKLEKYLATMKQNSLRLLKLINNIIDMTKIDASDYSIELQNYDIVGILKNVVQSIGPFAKVRGIDVTFYSDVEEKVIACDADKIERIILNLLSNALKFTDAGGFIKVKLKLKDKYVSISVEDNGAGIPKDKLNVIFQRFRQVDKSFTRNREGSGIGLSIVKALVEMHEGSISAESKYKKGSKFIIEIPVKVLDEKDCANVYSLYQDRIEERVKVELSDIQKA